MSSFCSAKATHIFSAKNIRILYIESAKTVNEMTLNELDALNNWALTARLCIFVENAEKNCEGPDQAVQMHTLT